MLVANDCRQSVIKGKNDSDISSDFRLFSSIRSHSEPSSFTSHSFATILSAQVKKQGSVLAGKHLKAMKHGSSILARKSPDFSGEFRLFSCAFRGKRPESHWKKSKKCPARILIPCSIDFQRSESSTWMILSVFPM